MGDPSPRLHLRVHAINIYVRDQEKSLRFFLDQLGFDLAFDAKLESGDRWLAVAPPDGSALLALIAPKPESREARLIGRPTGIVFVTEDVPAKYGAWRRRGVRFQYAPRLRRVHYERQSSPEDENLIWGGVFTHFLDPDGNSFALTGFDEVTREIEDQRRLIAERLQAEQRNTFELEIAKQVQARLFPQAPPPIQTLELSGICIQAREVGGDYFDFLDFGDGDFAIVTADIAGKGMAAALLMANLQANLRIQCEMASHQSREQLLHAVNRVFYKNSTESAYATMFFAEYNDGARRLRYANCGHLPALLLRNDGALERLESTGTVVGLFPEWDCVTEERTLREGDILAIYTDGVTEAFNEAGDDFGEDRLIDSLRRHAHLPPQLAVSALVDDVRRFSPQEQSDDITLIVAKSRA
jgi:serine phosphatase RsbU (regulator of sigma subunit)/catechol 2,3-dioxygenase-like lactoylglutathione lyase family enzyme